MDNSSQLNIKTVIGNIYLFIDYQSGSCVFQCDVLHQWIAQRQVSPVSAYCDAEGYHALCLRHGIPVWQHINQSTTATSDVTSDV